MLSRHLIDQARAVDLLALVSRYTTSRRVASTGGGEYAGPCPLCGGRDRFRVQPQRGRWMCRKCSARWDDAIALEMLLTRASFPDAVQALVGGHWLTVTVAAPAAEPRSPPSPQWQERARQVVTRAVRTLWTPRAQQALTWLYARGLTEDTLRRWQIGFLPGPRREPGLRWGISAEAVYVGAGVLIPGFTEK